MKPSSLSCVLLRLFIIVTTCSISSITTVISDDVVDITGDLVRNGGKYYIIPMEGSDYPTPTMRGRIKLTDSIYGEKICPLVVVLDPSDDKLGDGFYFSQLTRQLYLDSSNIRIDSGPPVGECEASTSWTIPDAEGEAPSNLITTGGGIYGVFQVVRYRPISLDRVFRPPTYMLQYCPETCFNISLYSYNGLTRLASSGDTPFEFGFLKAQASNEI
ncbi:unnamed protein product [Lactuca saligna]|uniref:Uncharacterized protein n=1 Tax=Lactuca saligna TaxID=75948 RepID=A0AA35ZRM4_LACSI|nr:unnamed protein product [Lactuca saligna]